MKSIKKLLLVIYIILNISYILIGSCLSRINVFNLNVFSKVYIVLFIINTLILLGIYIVRLIKKKKINFKITDIFIVLIIIFSIISWKYAVNTNYALYGFTNRYEGLFSILYYLTLYMLSTYIDKKYKKIIVYSILVNGFINFIYAVLQVMEVPHIVTTYELGKPWATGFLVNPNFFGTLMLFCLSYSIGLYIDMDKLYTKIINCILIFLFMCGLLISDTLSCVVGLFIIYIYLLIYIIKNKKYKKFIVITIILMLCSIFIHLSGKTVLFNDILKTGDQTLEMVDGNVDDNFGSGRIYIWKHTLRRVPLYIYHGVGIDNLYYAFGTKPLTRDGKIFDKAHNIFLQILICEGIFSLISYLLFYFTILIKGIINSFKNKEVYLVIPIIGYLVQGFFNISVIEIAPLFYIGLGLLTIRDNKYIK